MKQLFLLTLLFSIQLCYGQTLLTDPKSGCTFTLPWTSDQCTLNWTGECVNNLPEGSGILTVTRLGNEIMRYEGEMAKGLFHGKGNYRDGMSHLDGQFIEGNFINTNKHIEARNARINSTAYNKTKEWENKKLTTKQIDNLYFIFPGEGYAYEHRDAFVEQCLAAFKVNCALINENEYNSFTKIRFVKTKEEMLLHSGLYIKGGAADLQNRSIHMMVPDETTDKRTPPPIKHEIMHIVSMTLWGAPPQNMNWLNEGLATYAQNNCSGYSVAEIYRFFLENDMLEPIESLTTSFYKAEEMISYHQSAYLAEYLIVNYGIEKLEAFWKSGFAQFEPIYGLSFSEMEKQLQQELKEKYPNAPKIDWEVVKKGCQ